MRTMVKALSRVRTVLETTVGREGLYRDEERLISGQ